MAFTIFLSWQSDRPKKCNWTLIEDALSRAATEVGSDPAIGIVPAIDRDTADLPGSPDISSSIFAKIEAADLFVADVSLITDPGAARPTSNPNVLVELGYAAHCLGWQRIVMVFNTHWGRIEDLPFDLRHRRITRYSMRPDEPPATSREDLAAKLALAIRSARDHGRTARDVTAPHTSTATPTFSALDAMLPELAGRVGGVGKPPDMLVKQVVLGPADQAHTALAAKALRETVEQNTIRLKGWGGSPFPYGWYPHSRELRFPDRVEVVDLRAWPSAMRSFHYWGFDTQSRLFHVEDLREDNRAGANRDLSKTLAIEWALMDVVRPILFASRLMAGVVRDHPFRIMFFWQLGDDRQLQMLDERRLGFIHAYVSTLPVWQHTCVLERPDQVVPIAMAAAEALVWQFGWERDVETYLNEQISALADGRLP